MVIQTEEKISYCSVPVHFSNSLHLKWFQNIVQIMLSGKSPHKDVFAHE